jgi:hypothetical protein
MGKQTKPKSKTSSAPMAAKGKNAAVPSALKQLKTDVKVSKKTTTKEIKARNLEAMREKHLAPVREAQIKKNFALKMKRDLEETLKEVTASSASSGSANGSAKPAPVPTLFPVIKRMTQQKKNALCVEERQQFAAVLNDPDFKLDPFAAIAQHLEASMQPLTGRDRMDDE